VDDTETNMEDLGNGLPEARAVEPVRILLVDDNDDYRRQAARYLVEFDCCRVGGFAASGREAVLLAKQQRFDLVLMDLAMPEMGGFEATLRIKQQPNAPRVVIVSLGRGEAYRIASEAAKADGFLSKADFANEIGPLLERLFPEQCGREVGVP